MVFGGNLVLLGFYTASGEVWKKSVFAEFSSSEITYLYNLGRANEFFHQGESHQLSAIFPVAQKFLTYHRGDFQVRTDL